MSFAATPDAAEHGSSLGGVGCVWGEGVVEMVLLPVGTFRQKQFENELKVEQLAVSMPSH